MSSPAASDGLATAGEARSGSGRRGIGGAPPGKIGMWVFLGTDAMGFGGLLLGYAVLRTRAATWPDAATRFDRPLAAVLTFVLLASGATVAAAVSAARRGRPRAARALIALTVLGGLVFLAGQIREFHALVTTRQLGLTADHAASLFYLIAGYHGLHVLVGVVVLIAVGARVPAAQSPRGEAAADGLEVASLYWQFVDVVWIVIFTALYLLPLVGHG